MDRKTDTLEDVGINGVRSHYLGINTLNCYNVFVQNACTSYKT